MKKYEDSERRLKKLKDSKQNLESIIRGRNRYRQKMKSYDAMTMDQLRAEILDSWEVQSKARSSLIRRNRGWSMGGQKAEIKPRLPNGLSTRESRVEWLKRKLWKGGENDETKKYSDDQLRAFVKDFEKNIEGVEYWMNIYADIIKEKQYEYNQKEWEEVIMSSDTLNAGLIDVDFVVLFQRALYDLADMDASSAIGSSASDYNRITIKVIEDAIDRLKSIIVEQNGVLSKKLEDVEQFISDKSVPERMTERLYELIIQDLADRKLIKLWEDEVGPVGRTIKQMFERKNIQRPNKPLPKLPSLRSAEAPEVAEAPEAPESDFNFAKGEWKGIPKIMRHLGESETQYKIRVAQEEKEALESKRHLYRQISTQESMINRIKEFDNQELEKYIEVFLPRKISKRLLKDDSSRQRQWLMDYYQGNDRYIRTESEKNEGLAIYDAEIAKYDALIKRLKSEENSKSDSKGKGELSLSSSSSSLAMESTKRPTRRLRRKKSWSSSSESPDIVLSDEKLSRRSRRQVTRSLVLSDEESPPKPRKIRKTKANFVEDEWTPPESSDE